MKRVNKVLVLSIMSSLVLAGCFPNERNDLIEEARYAFANGDVVSAYSNFTKAKRLKDFSNDPEETEILSVYQEVVNKLYFDYFTNGNDLFEKRDYVQALENYGKAYAVYSADPALSAKIKETEVLVEEQKSFDVYVEFFSKVINDSNALLDTFDGHINNVYLENISSDEFITRVKSIVPKSNEVLSRFDSVHDLVSGKLYGTHESFLSLINYQHSTLIQAVEMKAENFNVSDLYTRYTTIKKTQNEMVQKVKKYADDNKLKANFDFNSVITEDSAIEEIILEGENLKKDTEETVIFQQ